MTERYLQCHVVCRKFTIGYADCSAADTTKTITLFTLPKGAVPLCTRTKHTVAFAGAGITDASFVVGISGTTNWLATDLDIDAAVANTTLVNLGVPTSNVGHAAVALIATVGSTGANLSLLTAGSVDTYLYYIEMDTPADGV